ncbi:MAG TPA: helix-turn-helix transcriptional regulator [Gallionella sp.]|nr:helix-turn-helix transcriptional regulator [Gallionella sp.]
MHKSKILLGNRIRYFRKKTGLSQERLAELLEISPNSVSRIECGVHYPSLDTLENISIILQVEMREFFEFKKIDTDLDKRAFLIQTACELGEEKLDEVVRAVMKMT